ncbi:hypothetical protein JN01_0457 [Entomoplasma freundtii]|uniref:Uncharacterized protein n=1 Tax=Entomoplasma freundtii TaxID=74700 RepID=A0A2K8NU37_9MOLU|nr:hypothetical protein [Entomoplasma freundtii]ATZ16143.1 hypothetical protein EFREU_v1c01160 [Entomoplasma freundtii]TDY56956.1 hypothetical protein JN01_0457 [Entomoplasma freundtii]
MINGALFKAEFKRSWVVVLIFSILAIGLAAFGLLTHWFYDQNDSNGFTTGTFVFLKVIIFHFGMPLLYTIYGFVIISSTLLKDIDKGYLASWLTTPLSRYKIFFTKIFVFLLGFVIISACLVISQMIFYGINTYDFSKGVGRLLLSDLALIVFGFFWLGIMWIIAASLPNNWSVWTVLIGLTLWFIVAYILGQGETLFGEGKLGKTLSYFRYFTILSLQKDSLSFVSEWVNGGDDGMWISMWRIVIPPIKAMDYAWQLPLMFVVGSACWSGSLLVLRNRSFNI